MFSSASNIWKRHHLLEETIGYLAVEKTSYENITTLFYISVFLVPILTILELTFYLLYQCKVSNSIYNIKQDGPSLESSSYLNVSLRYLGPWDPWTLGPLELGTLGPWDSWTSSLLQHLLILPHTSSYLLLLSSFCMVWLGGGRGVSCNNGG